MYHDGAHLCIKVIQLLQPIESAKPVWLSTRVTKPVHSYGTPEDGLEISKCCKAFQDSRQAIRIYVVHIVHQFDDMRSIFVFSNGLEDEYPVHERLLDSSYVSVLHCVT